MRRKVPEGIVQQGATPSSPPDEVTSPAPGEKTGRATAPSIITLRRQSAPMAGTKMTSRHRPTISPSHQSPKKKRPFFRRKRAALKTGSPSATLFITVLVLRLLTENRCESITYQRACGPRQGGNFDHPIFPLTLPKRGAASRVVNLSRVVSQTCRNDQPRSTCRLVTQFDTHFIRYYPIATWPSGVLILNHPAPDGQWRLRRPNPPQCRTCPFDPELSAQARAGKRGSFLGRNRRFRTGTVSLTDSTGR